MLSAQENLSKIQIIIILGIFNFFCQYNFTNNNKTSFNQLIFGMQGQINFVIGR